MIRGSEKEGGTRFLFIILLCVVVLSSVLVSAGILDWWNSITGRVSSATTDVGVTVSNTAPSITASVAPASVTPTAGAQTFVHVYFTVHDPDGSADIDLAGGATMVNASKSGETTVQNTSCISAGSINATALNISCGVYMEYWGSPGTWTVSITANDTSDLQDVDMTGSFTYDSLTAMTMDVTSLTFGSVGLAATNTGATNDPLTISDVGNTDVWTTVTSKNLLGYTTTTENITASKFKVDDASQGCSGTSLVNATSTNISAAAAITHAEGASGARYFCLTAVISGADAIISDQVYNTTGYGTWTVGVTAV